MKRSSGKNKRGKDVEEALAELIGKAATGLVNVGEVAAELYASDKQEKMYLVA